MLPFHIINIDYVKGFQCKNKNKLNYNQMKKKTNEILVGVHPPSREHYSLKIDVHDQTIWNCILKL